MRAATPSQKRGLNQFEPEPNHMRTEIAVWFGSGNGLIQVMV